MRMRPSLLPALTFLLAAPLVAQAPPTVDRLGFTFRIEGPAFQGVDAATAKRWTDADNGPDLPDPTAPAHPVFTLHPIPAAYLKAEERRFLDATLDLIPLSDATVPDFTKAYSDLVTTTTAVRKVLGTGPGHPALRTNLPEWALIDAAQSIHAKVQVIQGAWASGIAYLTQEVQDDVPVTNEGLLFIFQGVSRDGRWFISLKAPVSSPELVGPVPAVDWDSTPALNAYLHRMETRLDQAPDASFSPSLSGLLALVRSIQPSTPPR